MYTLLLGSVWNHPPNISTHVSGGWIPFVDLTFPRDFRSFQRDLMFFQGCLRIQSSKCRRSNDIFYDLSNHGLLPALEGVWIASTGCGYEAVINATDFTYMLLQDFGTSDVRDGLNRSISITELEVENHRYAMSLVCVIMFSVLIGITAFVVFRILLPLVNKIKVENEYTKNLILMLPREYLEQSPLASLFRSRTLES